ncbi:hypothetical protein AMS68_002633 [Peltaster fructicola]|uniref:Uncharacterized protein n=1 Tax=Peltaster fructicola TaxID=286661 RepID=A0A6H0XR06_9PEZI|nr:hypothetical protein AMS68_002633 [Peltaster fructicola]
MFRKKDVGIKKVWFLPRTRDNPPDDAIRLGDIILHPDEPEYAINQQERIEVPKDQIRTYVDPDSKWERRESKSVGGGISAAYLDAAGIKLSLDVDTSHKQTYEAERLETSQFSPSKKYLEECFKDGDAKIELTGPHAKKCLYMVTGLKLAYGATKTIEELHKRGLHVLFGLDLTAAGAPGVALGPKAHHSTEVETKGSSGKRNFVFAFQLRKLTWDKKLKVVVDENYVKGAMYSDAGLELEDADSVDVKGEDIESDEVSVEDFENLKVYAPPEAEEDWIALVA